MRSKRRSKLSGKTFPRVTTQRLGDNLEPIETVTLDVRKDFKIGPNLQREIREAAGLCSWYALLKEHAHAAMKQARYKAHKRSEIRYEEIKAEEGKLTETAIRIKIKRDAKWLKYTESYMLWRNRYRMLLELSELMRERMQNLRTLEASQRKEREATP